MPNEYHDHNVATLKRITAEMANEVACSTFKPDGDSAFYNWVRVLADAAWSVYPGASIVINDHVSTVIRYMQTFRELSIVDDALPNHKASLLALLLRRYHLKDGEIATLFHTILDSEQHRFGQMWHNSNPSIIYQAITFCAPDALDGILKKMKTHELDCMLQTRHAHHSNIPLELALEGAPAHWWPRGEVTIARQLQLVDILLKNGADPAWSDQTSGPITASHGDLTYSVAPVHKIASGRIGRCIGAYPSDSNVYIDMLKMALEFESFRNALSSQSNAKQMTPLLCLTQDFINIRREDKGPSNKDMANMFFILLDNNAQDLPDVNGHTAEHLLAAKQRALQAQLSAGGSVDEQYLGYLTEMLETLRFSMAQIRRIARVSDLANSEEHIKDCPISTPPHDMLAYIAALTGERGSLESRIICANRYFGCVNRDKQRSAHDFPNSESPTVSDFTVFNRSEVVVSYPGGQVIVNGKPLGAGAKTTVTAVAGEGLVTTTVNDHSETQSCSVVPGFSI